MSKPSSRSFLSAGLRSIGRRDIENHPVLNFDGVAGGQGTLGVGGRALPIRLRQLFARHNPSTNLLIVHIVAAGTSRRLRLHLQHASGSYPYSECSVVFSPLPTTIFQVSMAYTRPNSQEKATFAPRCPSSVKRVS